VIKCHTIHWVDCLSNKLFDAINKGMSNKWQPKETINIFWGLGADNISKIREAEAKGEEWWICDTGYLTYNINRYPKPEIVDLDSTYFRFCKGSLHNDLTNVSTDETRFNKLLEQNIWYPSLLENWEPKYNSDGPILLTPSSNGVCNFMYNISQDEWIVKAVHKIKKHTNKEIVLRNKPRPGNKYWGTTINDALKGCSAVVTNMSLCAIDAIMEGIPILTNKKNIISELGVTDYKDINNLHIPTKEEIKTWMCKAANTQFTLDEIKQGVPHEQLFCNRS
tara:strand:- start:1674 stop:2510 length:837 start_codon:yes stop_codon:yes gene_type:complete